MGGVMVRDIWSESDEGGMVRFATIKTVNVQGENGFHNWICSNVKSHRFFRTFGFAKHTGIKMLYWLKILTSQLVGWKNSLRNFAASSILKWSSSKIVFIFQHAYTDRVDICKGSARDLLRIQMQNSWHKIQSPDAIFFEYCLVPRCSVTLAPAP